MVVPQGFFGQSFLGFEEIVASQQWALTVAAHVDELFGSIFLATHATFQVRQCGRGIDVILVFRFLVWHDIYWQNGLQTLSRWWRRSGSFYFSATS
jgi:hypothetical protein